MMSFNYIIATLIIDGIVIAANIIELALLIKKWKRLDRIEHILFSLCLSDLFAGVTAFAQDAKQLKEMILHCETYLTDIEGYVFDCLFLFVVFSTNFHVTALAIERLVAVLQPLRYSLFETSKCKTFTILFVWVLAMILAPIVIVASMMVSSTGQNVAGIVLLIICVVVFVGYTLLVVALIIRERKMVALIPEEMRKQMRDRRTTYVCIVIGFSFVICVLPATIGLLNSSVYHDSFNILLTLNHLINPLIYFAKRCAERRRRSSSNSSSSTRLLSRTISRSISTSKS